MRFRYIDGLRGLAAFAVMLNHYVGHRAIEGRAAVLETIGEYGNLGVPVFFAISGFVIAHSVAGAKVTTGYYGNFVLRRVIRLDPPYWFAIAFFIVTTALANHLFPWQTKELPSIGNVVAHLFYVYPLFGYEPMEAIFWTLVHEVQFYLLYLAAIAVMQKTTGSESPTTRGAITLICIPAIASASVKFGSDGLCLGTWYMFAVGVMAYYYRRGWVSSKIVWLFWACIVATLAAKTGGKAAALLTALSFMLLTEQQMKNWLSAIPFQFLGRISYSLYLIHGMIGWRLLSVANADEWTMHPIPLLAMACMSSIVFAYLMRRFIEEPSINLAKRLKRDQP